jgi:hypothetical protein
MNFNFFTDISKSAYLLILIEIKRETVDYQRNNY